MAKRRRKRTITNNNKSQVSTVKTKEIKSEEEKQQEVANELCDRMLHKDETPKDKIKENTIEKEIINQEENTTVDDDLLDINEESYEVPQENIQKYIPEDMSELETFSGIIELVNKIYSSDVSKEEFKMASEVYDNSMEIYTDAAFNFPAGIKAVLCKGLEFLDKNKFSIASIINIVKEILSMEKAMLKCKVNVNKDEGIKVDVNVEDAGKTKQDEKEGGTKTEDVNQEEETKEQKKKKDFKDPFEGMDNPSLRLLRLICGIEK